MTRVAVIGHVEWVDFLQLKTFPRQGEVVHAASAFLRAGGGGAVAAVMLAELGAEVDFYTALGDDANGRAAAPRRSRQTSARSSRSASVWSRGPTTSSAGSVSTTSPRCTSPPATPAICVTRDALERSS